MRGAKTCHPALPALCFFLLFASSPGSASRSQSWDLQPPAGDRKTLLELLLQALQDSSSSHRRQVLPPPLGPERVISRRYTTGPLYPSTAVDQEARRLFSSSSSSSRERVAGMAPRPFTSSRHVEVFPRDADLKDKFIQHFTEVFSRDSALKDKIIQYFTGPVTFSAECSTLFYRLYHNTRDCSTPAYYKRCARLLKRLAMSPRCTQP